MSTNDAVTREQVLEWAMTAGIHNSLSKLSTEGLLEFVALARASAFNEAIDKVDDAWADALQSDLESGVKILNEIEADKFKTNYPELAKFGSTIRALKLPEVGK